MSTYQKQPAATSTRHARDVALPFEPNDADAACLPGLMRTHYPVLAILDIGISSRSWSNERGPVVLECHHGNRKRQRVTGFLRAAPAEVNQRYAYIKLRRPPSNCRQILGRLRQVLGWAECGRSLSGRSTDTPRAAEGPSSLRGSANGRHQGPASVAVTEIEHAVGGSYTVRLVDRESGPYTQSQARGQFCSNQA
jgi:hypothetical protein